MTELPRAALAVLERARSAHDPGPVEVERSLALLHDNLSFAADVGAGGSDVGAADASTLGMSEPVASSLSGGAKLLSAKLVKLYVVAAAIGGAVAVAALLPRAPLSTQPASRQPAAQTTQASPHEALQEPPQAVPKAAPEEVASREVHEVHEVDAAQAQPWSVRTTSRSASDSRRGNARTTARSRAAASSASAAAVSDDSATALAAQEEVAAAANVEAAPGALPTVAEQPVAVAATSSRELALIDAAATSLRDGQPERALSLLDEHLTQYPAGILRSERQGLRVLALCAAGRVAQAREERTQFLQHAGRTPLAARVRRACVEQTAR